jgi:hypothetical protein
LAIFLGHYYDQTIFLQTGYLVASGLNPYQPHVVAVFANPYLNGVSNVIGYPPPWTFLLGLIYKLTYAVTPNIFLYNFATKIPIITTHAQTEIRDPDCSKSHAKETGLAQSEPKVVKKTGSWHSAPPFDLTKELPESNL